MIELFPNNKDQLLQVPKLKLPVDVTM